MVVSKATFGADFYSCLTQTYIFASNVQQRVFKAIIITFLSGLLVIPIIASMPKDYPFNKDELLKSGIDADIVELEPEEKGK